MKGIIEFYGCVSRVAYNTHTGCFESQSLACPLVAEPVPNASVSELFSLVRGAGRSKPNGRFEGMRRVHDEYVPVLAKRVGR